MASALLIAGVFTGCLGGDDDSDDGAASATPEPPPREGAYPPPDVTRMKDNELWNELDTPTADRRVLVTLKDPGDERGYFNGRVLISRDDYATEKANLLESIEGVEVTGDRPIELTSGAKLPTFEAKLRSDSALQELRDSRYVDFVEPAVVPTVLSAVPSFLGCGVEQYVPSDRPRAKDGPLPAYPGQDIQYPGEDLVPYPYRVHGVLEAWQRLSPWTSRGFPGAGHGIAVLDTGLSSTQQQFFDRYARFYPRRPLLRVNKTDADIEDRCSHGTKMASLAAAPRDGRSIVGVAWGAPLLAIKVNHAPPVDIIKCDEDDNPQCRLAGPADVRAVCDGIREAVLPSDGQPPAKVIALALGFRRADPTIQDCIANAFKESETSNTIFVVAAGSGVPVMTYPSTLNAYVLAIGVVGIDHSGTGYRLLPGLFNVAYGESVDFVSAYDADALVPAAGLTGNDHLDEIVQFSRTSAGTAIYAGLIALVSQYADQQGWNREQLISALNLASSRNGITDVDGKPPRNVIGAGILDVYRATGGARHATITAPAQVPPGQSVFLVGSVDAVVPPGARRPSHFRYSWTANGQPLGEGPKVTATAPESGTLRVDLTVRDEIDGNMVTANEEIQVVGGSSPLPEPRTLYWASYVADYAKFFLGGRYDRIVNPSTMPDGCIVEKVRGLPMVKDGDEVKPADGESPQESWQGFTAGFTVSRPQGIPGNSLEVLVHQWHDGFSAVRTKVVYDVLQPAGVDCAVAGVLTSSP